MLFRSRKGGSSGGHNGLKDIIEKVGEDFVRFRVGIKNASLEKIPSEKFVLSRFSTEEQSELDKIIKNTLDLLLDALQNGIEHKSLK